jgi:hypothetical protein
MTRLRTRRPRQLDPADPADRSRRRGGPSRLDSALLPFFGPAQISPVHAIGTVSDDAREREAGLRSRYERVVGPDGHAYVVARDDD